MTAPYAPIICISPPYCLKPPWEPPHKPHLTYSQSVNGRSVAKGAPLHKTITTREDSWPEPQRATPWLGPQHPPINQQRFWYR